MFSMAIIEVILDILLLRILLMGPIMHIHMDLMAILLEGGTLHMGIHQKLTGKLFSLFYS